MSLSQFLIKPYQEYGDFAISWQAGIAGSQSFTKLKNYDIEAVNVANTCEKLNSSLQNARYFMNEFQGHEDSEKQCAVKISNIPFRAATNIWFGSLKIYQEQVNNLFRLSKDLLVRCNKNNLNQLQATKRKSSLKSNKIIKKRRLTISNTNETLISSNYTQLIDELEKLTHESELNSNDEFSNVISNSCSVTQLQIREITIREISETTIAANDIEEEDSGFGEATHDDIEYFFNFTDNNLQQITNNVRKSLPGKRKSIAEYRSPIKQSRYSIDYSSKEPSFNENLTKLADSISPFKGFETHLEDLKTLMKDPKNDENNNYTPLVIETVKQEPIEDYSFVKHQFNRPIKKFQKKKSKLIIDVCTKIDINEILHEMKKSKVIIRSARKKFLKFYKTKKFATALDLLNMFNRGSLKLSQILKHRIYYTYEQFQKEYLNILRDIFERNFNEKLASDIYCKWQCSPKIRKQNKHNNLSKEFTKEVLCQQQLEIDSYNSSDYINTFSDPGKNNLHNKNNENNNGNSKSEFSCNQNVWGPYGVMMKLLNLCRCRQTSKIEAAVLFKLAENRFDTALCFYSLLLLSKNRFVVLTTFPETIILQNIEMGEATKIVANNSP